MAPSHYRDHPFGVTVLLVKQSLRQTLAIAHDGLRSVPTVPVCAIQRPGAGTGWETSPCYFC